MEIRKLTAVAGVLAVSAALLSPGVAAKPAAAHDSAFKITGAKTRTLTNAQLSAAERTATRGAASADKKSLAFRGETVRLVVTTGPEDDMLSYRIAGLRNPTLVVRPGTLLKILFVNTDEDMTHDLRFGAMKAPFPSRIPRAGLAGSALLPHRTGKSMHGEEVAIRVPARKGSYSYLCTVPGHAAGGMYGRLTVR